MNLTPDQFRCVAEIFAKACALPPDERADFLARACGDDAELRAQVERLLADDDIPVFKLDAPAIAQIVRAESSVIFVGTSTAPEQPQHSRRFPRSRQSPGSIELRPAALDALLRTRPLEAARRPVRLARRPAPGPVAPPA